MSAITLLDGGMGQELIHRAGDRPTPLWSTHVMREYPGMVQGVHADFFAAGASIATANTYAIHRDRLVVDGAEDQFDMLYETALAEAVAARGATGGGQIAGAIGPLIASYRPDLHPPLEQAMPLYAEIAAKLAATCDLILLETVSSILQATSALRASVPFGKPVWLALSVMDTDGTRLRSGEALTDAIPAAQAEGAAAILINCCTPEVIPDALNIIAQAGLPYGAYANGFEKIADGFLDDKPTVDALTLRHDFTPEAYADHVMGWVDQGASIVGGCCEVSPTHIAEIATRLRAGGHTIV